MQYVCTALWEKVSSVSERVLDCRFLVFLIMRTQPIKSLVIPYYQVAKIRDSATVYDITNWGS